MHLRVFTIGKPRLAFAKAGVAEYLARFPAKNAIELESLRASTREDESKVSPDGEKAKKMWPWHAVLAVAELLDWGTIGNLVGHELNQVLQLAHLQQRAAIIVQAGRRGH